MGKKEETSGGTGKKKKIANKIFVFLLLVVIVILGIIIYKLLHKEPEDRRASEGLAVDPTADENYDPTFTTDMNMVWVFPSGKRTSTNAQIGNSGDNQYPAYFEVFLDDEDQTLLYSSPVLPVGKRLNKLKLDKTLSDGEHPAICTFHILKDEESEEEISKVSFGVTLIFMKDAVSQAQEP